MFKIVYTASRDRSTENGSDGLQIGFIGEDDTLDAVLTDAFVDILQHSGGAMVTNRERPQGVLTEDAPVQAPPAG